MPGVQKPHCRAWCRRKLSCSRDRPAAGEMPSMVVTAAPSAWTASIRQPRMASPSKSTRAGAADAMLAAEMGAGQIELVAQRFGEALARLDRAAPEPRR